MPRESNKNARRRQRLSSNKKAKSHQTEKTAIPLVEQDSPAQTESPWKPGYLDGTPSTNTLQESSQSRRNSSSSACSIPSASASASASSPSPSPPTSRNPILTRSTTSLPPPTNLPRSPSPTHLPNFLAPPFYNRPQTPLPPSPSLTSLLRPSTYSASASPSRPTTPTDSEAENIRPGASTTTLNESAIPPSALLSTAQPPIPRAIPKVPTHEYYGFTLYLTSTLFFLFHILWSFLPAPFLHGLGIYYYPDRWWSLAIPAWIVMAVGFVYVALGLYNTEVLTPEIGDLRGVVDRMGVVAIVDEQGRLEERYRRGDGYAKQMMAKQWRWKDVWAEGTDAVLDIPVGGVCEVLYAEDTDDE